MVVGRLLSYWEGNFSGAMLDFRGVDICQDVHITSGSTFARPPPKKNKFFLPRTRHDDPCLGRFEP